MRSESFGAIAAQTRVLDRWVDGSVRWLLVDAKVSTASDAGAWALERVEGVTAAAGELRVSSPHGGVAVETGQFQFRLTPDSTFPLEVRGAGGARHATARLTVTAADGSRSDANIRTVRIEEEGPLRVVVRIDGDVRAGERRLDVFARVHFYAGLPTMRLLVTLRNPDRARHKGGFWDLGDPGSMLIKDASMSFEFPTAANDVRVSCEADAPFVTHAAPVEVYQDSSGGDNWRSTNHINRERRIPVTFRGYRLRTPGGESGGLRATPVVCAGAVGIAVPAFWQNFPQAIEASADSLTWRMFPGQFADLHEIQGGEQKTHEAFVTFGNDEISGEPLDWCRHRVVATVDPSWVIESEAVPFLAPLDPAHAALVQSAIEGPDSFEFKREVIDEYGWRHFGDLYGDHESVRQKDLPIVSHYNNQYDAAAGFIHQFLRTSDPRWWELADDLVRHVIDIDIYHTDRDKAAYNGGLFWHTYHYGDADIASHRTYPRASQGRTHGGGPSAGHNYTTGLMLHFFLTGEISSLETVIGLGRFVVNMDDGSQSVFRWLARGSTGHASLSATGYFGPGRGPANSLNALVDAHRLSGDPAFIEKAEELLRRVIHPRQDIAALRLDNPEQRWFYTMFLQSLGKYIRHKRERGELDSNQSYATASLQHFARWMAVHEHPYFDRPERLEFPTETWPAQDIRKSDAFCHAALQAEGEERQTFLERAAFFRSYSLKTLAASPTRTLLRPVVILLTSGTMLDWWTVRPYVAESPPTPAADFGEMQPFVPQRLRAERRAKLLAIGAGAAVIVAAAAWLFS